LKKKDDTDVIIREVFSELPEALKGECLKKLIFKVEFKKTKVYFSQEDLYRIAKEITEKVLAERYTIVKIIGLHLSVWRNVFGNLLSIEYIWEMKESSDRIVTVLRLQGTREMGQVTSAEIHVRLKPEQVMFY